MERPERRLNENRDTGADSSGAADRTAFVPPRTPSRAETVASSPPGAPPRSPVPLPAQIGRYRILRLIEQGMDRSTKRSRTDRSGSSR